jgi:hypothetical protein
VRSGVRVSECGTNVDLAKAKHSLFDTVQARVCVCLCVGVLNALPNQVSRIRYCLAG